MVLAGRGRRLAKLPHKIISVAGRVGDTSAGAPPLPCKNLQFLSSFFVAWELMDLVSPQGFLAAQRPRMDTAPMNLTTTATVHGKRAAVQCRMLRPALEEPVCAWLAVDLSLSNA